MTLQVGGKEGGRSSGGVNNVIRTNSKVFDRTMEVINILHLIQIDCIDRALEIIIINPNNQYQL